MTFLGDLALIIGMIGVVVYMCLIIIRYTTRSGNLKEIIEKYEGQTVRLQEKTGELKQRREEKTPEVDELVGQVIEMRETRDKLQLQYGELVEKSRERDIHIKSLVSG